MNKQSLEVYKERFEEPFICATEMYYEMALNISLRARTRKFQRAFVMSSSSTAANTNLMSTDLYGKLTK